MCALLTPSARRNSEKRRVWAGVPYVVAAGWSVRFDPRTHPGTLNWATGETLAVKEIQLSNTPKGELGQLMVRVSPRCALLPFLTVCLQSEIDLLKNLKICARV
jgi:hypothetical protein